MAAELNGEAAAIPVNTKLIEKYAAAVPRYTSYPTAPHFHEGIGAPQYARWLGEMPEDARLSIYTHIPFCDSLCWFCGCNTKMVRRYEPVAQYLPSLHQEIVAVAELLPRRHKVDHIHWGGGSPDILNAADVLRLAEIVQTRFDLSDDCEFAVEIDPRQITARQVHDFACAGVTRVSIGVQDFAPEVQAAINRHQSFEVTKKAVDLFRSAGVRSINFDLIYGLPLQTRASVEHSVEQVLELEPDRIALFGYAHLPKRLRHQSMIDERTLPGAVERFVLASSLARRVIEAGYVRVGLDHFARPEDTLAAGPLRRNFQGYTSDGADTLIGFGASAISKLPQGYIQNAVPTNDYKRRVSETGLAAARGYEFNEEDRMRGFVIERLMCDMRFPEPELLDRYGADAAGVVQEAKALLSADTDELLEPSDSGFRVTEKGRPFLRTICAHFDSFFKTSEQRHSMGV